MADDEAKILKRKEPPRHSGVSVLGPSHPLEGRVVRQEHKLTAEKMITELQDCPFYGQSLLLDCRVVLLGWRQLPADEQDGMFLTFLDFYFYFLFIGLFNRDHAYS